MKKTLIKSSVLLAASLSMILALGSCSVDSSDDTAPKSDASSNVTPSSPSSPSTPSTTDPVTPPADISNASVEIVKSEGWLNSAYIIFKQLDGATGYKVYVDDKALDEPLIRYYDTYTYYEQSEDSDLQVTWTKNQSLTKVVRADALGLAAGSHTMKVCATNANGDTEYSSSTMTVINHDRSGFAFTDGHEPGSYKADGTLKDGAVVIYLTQANKKTVKATLGGTEYTGIQEITQAIKAKKISTPVDIRIIGTVKAESNDLSCSDLSSAYALGVKEAKNVTIEGVGHDATLYGAGVAAFKSENIEIANLGLIKWGGGKDGDGISLKEDSYAWVHNCEYFYGDAGSDADQAKGDGSMDLKDDSNHVTISYNHFWDSGKMSLCGMKSESGPNYITYHHNWFDHSDSRHPRIRTMTVHVYNNYFDGNAKYGVGVTTGANAFVEQNFFRNAHDPMMSSKQGTDAQGDGTFSGESGGVIKAYNNKFVQNNTNGVKFQFITNKYDYTNNKELGEYKEWYETVGTDNGDGTWTIYDSKVDTGLDEFASNSLIGIDDAANKGSYYQVSKSKNGFNISVPANTTKVIVRAKCGSSGKSGTSNMISVNGQKFSIDLAADYAYYEATVSGLTGDSVIEIANADSNNSMNVKEIKVIATSGWETKLTSGADMTNIDAYEVDNRSDTVPDTVSAKSGGAKYSNFDTKMGSSGLGLSLEPSGPDQAKADVLKYSGRHDSDYAWTFTNATDDASYALNAALNSELLAYKTSMTKIQGESTSSSSGGSGNSGSGESGDTPSTDEPVTPAPSGTTATLTFSDSGSLTPVSTGITFTVAGDAMDFYPSTGKIKVSKVNSKFSVSFTTPGLSTEKYSMVVGYFNKNTASELEVKASGAETGSKITIAASAGAQGESKNLVGATVNSEAIELAGGTAYTVTRSGSKEFGLVSITITKAE